MATTDETITTDYNLLWLIVIVPQIKQPQTKYFFFRIYTPYRNRFILAIISEYYLKILCNGIVV